MRCYQHASSAVFMKMHNCTSWIRADLYEMKLNENVFNKSLMVLGLIHPNQLPEDYRKEHASVNYSHPFMEMIKFKHNRNLFLKIELHN